MDQDVVPLVPLEDMVLPAPEGWTLAEQLATWRGTRVFDARGPGAMGVAFVTHTKAAMSAAERRNNTLATFAHPAMIPVLATGQVGPFAYRLDAEAPGPASDVHARLEGPLPVDSVLQITLTLTQLLVELHARAFVHGRVEPESVRIEMRRGQPAPVLCDAAATLDDGPGRQSAPELHAGHPADPRSDLFGLGLTVIALLTGAVPEVRSDRTSGPACSLAGLSVDTRLFRLVESLVDADPNQRPRSASEVADTLARLRGVTPTAFPWLPLTIGVAFTLTVGGIFWATRPDRAPSEPVPVVQPAPRVEPVVEPEPEPQVAVIEPATPTVEELPAEPAPRVRTRAAAPVEEPVELPVEEPTLVEEPLEELVEVVEEPAVVEVVEDTPPEPTIVDASGTWSGQANGRSLTISITQSGTALSGQASLQLGAQVQKRPVTGSIEGDRVVLVEQVNRGSTYTMVLAGGSATGSISQAGRDRGTLSLSR